VTLSVLNLNSSDKYQDVELRSSQDFGHKSLDYVFIVANYSASLLPIILHYGCQLVCIPNCHFLCIINYRLKEWGNGFCDERLDGLKQPEA
jgi:hypothetical protein